MFVPNVVALTRAVCPAERRHTHSPLLLVEIEIYLLIIIIALVGRCNRPLTPDHGKVVCNSTRGEVDCDVKCEDGYLFPDNATSKSNKCWHVTGVWKPMKNFPACQREYLEMNN
ncbi:hypothetical protein AVEN_218761-1 [Araneus ventricosus]|uniref:Sushi domain-containing protein n=1 Tax=Araneus ventricosus TaxID=182803 RepID=A0A4Y2B6V1_ARAVE|nr:hypothetical protein AVEN_218761-1 [Araneus ventricosus]